MGFSFKTDVAIFIKKASIIFCLLFAAACFSKATPSVNAEFEKKYGKEVEKMRLERAVDSSASSVTVSQSPYATDMLRPENDYYAYVDVRRFNERAPEIYLPNGESYEHTRRSGPDNSVPPDIFDINYNLGVYSAFRTLGAEFDRIYIPPQDVYGVETKMSDKEYLLAGNNALQRSIDNIEANKSSGDIENSEIIIRERRAARIKAQMKKNFGSDEVSIVSLVKKEKKE
jgi:hypothetical protein